MGDCSEDWCFHCKDGGTLRLCDHEDCDKAYHPKCVGRKNSFLKTKKPWTCSKHSCHVCRKNKSTTAAAISFSCLCCPYALCEPCYEESIASNAPEFSLLRGKDNKLGLCNVCLEKIRLVEANSEEGPDGEQRDLDEQEYSLLKGYWEIIKEKEGSSLDDVYSPNAAKRKRSDPLLQFCNYMKPEARKLRASAGLRETKIKSDECWKFKDSDSC